MSKLRQPSNIGIAVRPSRAQDQMEDFSFLERIDSKEKAAE